MSTRRDSDQHAFLARECAALGWSLPSPRHYGAGLVFLPRDEGQAARCRAMLDAIVREEGQALVEYTLILALVSIVAIALLTSIGTDIKHVIARDVKGLEKA